MTIKGWILCPQRKDKKLSYCMKKLLSSALSYNIQLTILEPDGFDFFLGNPSQIYYQKEKTALPDFALCRMGSKTTAQALRVLEFLSIHKVPVINSASSIANAADKWKSYQMLSAAGMPVPRTFFCRFPLHIGTVMRHFSYPVIVKTLHTQKGKGVLYCSNEDQLKDVLNLLCTVRPQLCFLIQEWIGFDSSRDIRVLVLNGKAIAAGERVGRNGRFKANVADGAVMHPFLLQSDVARLAEQSAAAFGLDFAGVDILENKEGYKIGEVNSSPGFEALEKVSPVSIVDNLWEYVKNRIQTRMAD